MPAGDAPATRSPNTAIGPGRRGTDQHSHEHEAWIPADAKVMLAVIFFIYAVIALVLWRRHRTEPSGRKRRARRRQW